MHPSTSSDKRIVTELQLPKRSTTFADSKISQTPSLATQFYQMSNPYAQPLLNAEREMNSVMQDENLTLEEKVKRHSDALNLYTLMRDNYQSNNTQSMPVLVENPTIKPSPPENDLENQQESFKEQDDDDVNMSDDDDRDIYNSMLPGKLLPDGTSSELLSFEDTSQDRKQKQDYINKHILRHDLLEDPEPAPGEDDRLYSFEDTESERQAKDRYVSHMERNTRDVKYNLRKYEK